MFFIFSKVLVMRNVISRGLLRTFGEAAMSYPKSKFLETLGVQSIINVENWSTASVGGSVVPQAVLDVICDVERVYCNIM